MYEWFEDRFGLKGGTVGGKLLTEDRQLSNRIEKELARLDPEYIVLCALSVVNLEAVRRHLKSARLPKAKAALILQEQTPVEFQVYASDTVTAALAAGFPMITPKLVKRTGSRSTTGGLTGVASGMATKPTLVVPLAIDDRVRRMVELAILSTSAVILVGPPGTGKTQLLRETIDKIEADPAAFGLSSAALSAAMWTTPEESWTTRELVGGETVDEKHRLRYRPGYLLNSIAENRWLVLDETNRADMDRIFGPILTWLSSGRTDETVELGTATTDLGAPKIVLGWSGEAESKTSSLDQLGADSPTGDAIEFRAGNEWRLLGTYNALDAQRVFRFGEALGRRFARVPIPAPDVEAFRESLAEQVVDLDGWEEKVVDAVIALYGAHQAASASELGPALFVKIPDYVRSGIKTSAAVGDAYVAQLLAEGYVVSVGTWLARLEEHDLQALKARVLGAEAITEDQWDWIISLLPALG
jgi:MoxR-like ATPase